ncbi:MAG: hypothetical protein MUF09_11405 [Candidatus Nanopelagicales bacterium]|nr:hypothetical protein [Candidatus Nanopelagicales bacterium]
MTATATVARKRHDVRNAWISLVFIPVSLVLADGVLHGLLGLMGIDEMAVPEQTPTLLQALLAGIPYTVVMLLPGIGAFWFGTNALNDGNRRGRIPSMIGLVWGVVVLIGALVFLFLVMRGG